jgi:hypothetical protein
MHDARVLGVCTETVLTAKVLKVTRPPWGADLGAHMTKLQDKQMSNGEQQRVNSAA